MFGLDDTIAGFSDGTTVLLVMLVAILLGLRHASDPDHLAAMTTLIASGRERAGRGAAKLGFAWGLGHGTTLFIFGLPIVLFDKYLPERALQLAETAIAAVIVLLAARLLLRWRRGFFHAHEHEHEGSPSPHGHLHAHAENPGHGHPHPGSKPAWRLRDRARARDGWKRRRGHPDRRRRRGDVARGRLARPARRLHRRLDDTRDRGLRPRDRLPTGPASIRRSRQRSGP
jgi:hypothetical protein